jgi:parallel beta-helix repeat protein
LPHPATAPENEMTILMMERNEIAIMLLYILLFSLSFSTFNIHLAKTEPITITVPTDYPTIQEAINAANPGDTILVLEGIYVENIVINKTVTLIGENMENTIIDGNRNGTVINVTVDNVTISGFTIKNSAQKWPNSGILINNVRGCNITNNLLTANDHGILLNNTESSLIINNFFNDNWAAVELFYAFNITLKNNSINNNEFGIWVFNSNNNIISNNNVTENKYGLWLFDSSYNILNNNQMTLNQYNFGVWGAEITHYLHEIDTSNLVNSKPIYYWINKHKLQVPIDAGYIAIINSTEITIENITITNNGQGALLVYTENSLIANSLFIDNYAGVEIINSFSNTVICNNVTSNLYGIVHSGSHQNKVAYNKVSNNKYGVKFVDSNSNHIYANAFENNIIQVINTESINLWDEGYPSGGNYWSDYAGVDQKSGPNQDQPGSDGIGDTPYIIDENNTDRYPLMEPVAVHEIAITNITPSKTVIGQGFTFQINVQTENKGNRLEAVNITLYINTTAITKTLNLTLGTTTITFTVNTTNWTKGNYTIKAYAQPIPDEKNTEDNTLTYNGKIIITVPGDVDGDREINIYDIVRLASAYGSKIGEPRYVPNCDIDGNGQINIYDVVIATSRYGYKEH